MRLERLAATNSRKFQQFHSSHFPDLLKCAGSANNVLEVSFLILSSTSSVFGGCDGSMDIWIAAVISS